MKRAAIILSVLMLLTGCASGGTVTEPAAETVPAESSRSDEAAADSMLAESSISAEPPVIEAEPLTDVVQEENGAFTCTYAGISHACVADFPAQTEGAPLILVLHGYSGTAESFRSAQHFEAAANPRGYAVVYVTGAPDPNDPTSGNGWDSGLGQAGNPDTAFLKSLALYLQETCQLDPNRTFAVGFSNGAFMTHRLAMEASDTFAAVVSVAGMMPKQIWESRNGTNSVGVFQITGEKDDVVPKNSDGSAKTAEAPAIEDVMDYWAESNGLSEQGREEIGNGSELIRFAGSGSQKQVWHLRVKNGRHSWPSPDYTGIDTDTLILDFLDTQRGVRAGNSLR